MPMWPIGFLLLSYLQQKIEMDLISTLLILNKAQKQVQITQIQSCSEVDQLLLKILSDNSSTLKQLYTLLETVLKILSKKRGPKSFTKLLNQIFDFIKKYSFDRIRAYQEQIVILNLTYYEKIIKDCLTNVQKLQIIIIFASANLHAYLRNFDGRRLNSLQDKIEEATKIQIPEVYISNILNLFSGIIRYLRGENKKSKTIFANLLTKIITEQKNTINCNENLQLMAICSFYSYLNLYELGQIQLSYYYLTKAHEFGKKIDARAFLQRIREIGQHKSFGVVRLTRIENKIQILNRRTKSTWNTKPKIYNQKQKCNKDMINEQLKNIFTIKDTKATMYKFRKDNLKYLKRQENKLLHCIQDRQMQIKQIETLKRQLEKLDQINKIKEKVQELHEERLEIRSEFQSLKFKHLKSLKPVKIINLYLRSYLYVIQYVKQFYIYNFLYRQNNSSKKLIVLSEINKKRMAKIKINVKLQKILYKGLKYFVQIFQIMGNQNTNLLLYKKKDPGFYLRVYPLQKKPGLKGSHAQKMLKIQTFQKLRKTPFYLQFQCVDNKLIYWDQYLSRKSLLTIFFIRKFILKLTKKGMNKEKECQQFKKMYVNFKLENRIVIQTVLFVWIKKIINQFQEQRGQQKYQVYIFTVGGQRYANKLYNIKLQQKIERQTNLFSDETAVELVKVQLMKNFSQKINQIYKIQRLIKVVYCKRYLRKLREKNKVYVIVQGNDILTYCKYQSGKCVIIAENIQNRDRQMVQTIMDYSLFIKINSIKDRLLAQRNCKEKLKIICKFIWTKYFIQQLKINYKRASLLTDFQVSFRNRIIFSKIFNSFIYQKKLVKQKVVFTLLVESLVEFPRPYYLRFFTITQTNACLDIKYRIYNREKLFYQKNNNNLNKIINFISKKEFQILDQNQLSEQFYEQFVGHHQKSKNSFFNKGCRSSFSSACSGHQNEVILSKSIIPKTKSKKGSMLIRLKNRKSSQFNINLSKLKITQNVGSQDNDSKKSVQNQS